MLKLFMMLLFLVTKDVISLRNVRVVFPKSVTEGGSATMLCLYDLQGEKLYSVKWYRGTFEIFRYLPEENPRTRIFSLPGLNVDLKFSNANRLILLGVPKYLGGNYTCEVTTEEPTYSTAIITEYLQVHTRDVSENLEEATESSLKSEAVPLSITSIFILCSFIIIAVCLSYISSTSYNL